MKVFKFFFILFIMVSFSTHSQIEGRWKTVDDKSGKIRSVVEIYKKSDGKYYGKIAELHEEIPAPVCVKCPGALKNKPIIGLEIIQGLEAVNGKWENGKIIDPESGKTYSCKAQITKGGDLNLRGYLGFSLLGRTQTWLRE